MEREKQADDIISINKEIKEGKSTLEASLSTSPNPRTMFEMPSPSKVIFPKLSLDAVLSLHSNDLF